MVRKSNRKTKKGGQEDPTVSNLLTYQKRNPRSNDGTPMVEFNRNQGIHPSIENQLGMPNMSNPANPYEVPNTGMPNMSNPANPYEVPNTGMDSQLDHTKYLTREWIVN